MTKRFDISDRFEFAFPNGARRTEMYAITSEPIDPSEFVLTVTAFDADSEPMDLGNDIRWSDKLDAAILPVPTGDGSTIIRIGDIILDRPFHSITLGAARWTAPGRPFRDCVEAAIASVPAAAAEQTGSDAVDAVIGMRRAA